MAEHHPDGFRKRGRAPIGKRPPRERRRDYRQIHAPAWEEARVRAQGERCMDCGVPTCMGGCPIGNLVPEWNDLVFRGRWRAALERLHATNNFPEFTGYTCPAPCEPACTLAYNDEAVTIKDIERAIVDRGWERGWIVPEPPAVRTGRRVAIVGSGPAGLAAAQQLNRAGHSVTVLERDEAPGGLMTFGIPDFKFEKHRVRRRIEQLAAEGIAFRTGVTVGRDVTLERLREDYDAVCLAIGALAHRELDVPGRELAGIHPGMDYLTAENRRQGGRPVAGPDARGKRVVVLGGGDTGADCVATAHRQGAAAVTQIGIRARPPGERPEGRPWPWQPQTYERSYALEEGGTEVFSVETGAFLDEDGDGRVDALGAARVEWDLDERGVRTGKRVIESGLRIPAELVLLAVGFAGPQLDALGAGAPRRTGAGHVATNPALMTDREGVFAAGDCRVGASLVVWAIGEGRDAAHHIDAYLMGGSDLPRSLQSRNPPTEAPRLRQPRAGPLRCRGSRTSG